ncbi:MAG: hypothetical protein ACT4N9_01545 [Paracoccaceae bacterium]
MLSTAVSAASSLIAHRPPAGTSRPPGPPIHALLNPGRLAAQAAPPRENATGSDPMALFEGILARRDADADGQLSAAEAATGRHPNLSSAIFGVIDTDGDAVLSQAEMTEAAAMLSDGVSLRALARQDAAAAAGLGPGSPVATVPEQTTAAPPPADTAPASAPVSQAQSVIEAALLEQELLLQA